MSTQDLNKRKNELLDQQTKVLNSAQEAHRKLTDVEEAAFTTMSAEIDDLVKTIGRFEAIAKSKSEIALPGTDIVITDAEPMLEPKKLSAAYRKAFWNAISTRNFSNAALAESTATSAADGSYLVPTQTDPTIAALAPLQAAARSLSLVIPTTMDIRLGYQATRTVAAGKLETYDAYENNTRPFARNVPTFNTTTLTAYQAGDAVQISWELLQDVPALEAFVNADLNRAVFNYEETKFVGGSGTGEPLGYLNGATDNGSVTLDMDAILDLTGDLNPVYLPSAKFLMHRRTLIQVIKEQIAASQFQTFVTFDTDGTARLLGYPVAFSAQMPVYSASPSVSGKILFGAFDQGWVIGDRGGSAIRVKLLDQIAALQGATVIMGYRRTDQRCRLQESVQMITITG